MHTAKASTEASKLVFLTREIFVRTFWNRWGLLKKEGSCTWNEREGGLWWVSLEKQAKSYLRGTIRGIPTEVRNRARCPLLSASV